MICEKCGKEHDGSFGSGRFCSRACANSRIKTEETRKKVSLAFQKRSSLGLHNKPYPRTRDSIERWKESYRKNHQKEILTCSWCGSKFEKKRMIPKSGRVYCNGHCRNMHLNRLKLIGGLNNKKIPKWEMIFEELLKEYKIEYVHNCRDILPDGLELDFWIPDKKLGIELNGIFHYSEKPFGGNIEAFKHRKDKDLRKVELMKKLGFSLIVVDYRDVKRNYKTYFNNLINQEILDR